MKFSVTCASEHNSKNSFLLSTEPSTLIQWQIMGKGECVFPPFFPKGLEVVATSLTFYLSDLPSSHLLDSVNKLFDNRIFQHIKGDPFLCLSLKV